MRDISSWVVSFPLTSMRDISGWVVSMSLFYISKERDFIFRRYPLMIVRGFYLIKDEFFEIMNDPCLMNNKEGNRPFYYCVVI